MEATTELRTTKCEKCGKAVQTTLPEELFRLRVVVTCKRCEGRTKVEATTPSEN